MLDDLRSEAQSSYEEQQNALQEQQSLNQAIYGSTGEKKNFLGMTPFQRFLISILLFVMVVILGALILVAAGKVVLPL